MEHHIGYEKYDKSPKQAANRRNGYSQKRVTSGDDTLDLNIPRDRDADFEPQLIPKGVRQFDGFDDKVISLYARGMTMREIREHLVGVNFKTSAYFYHRLRELISLELAHQEEEVFGGEIEVDESYFGGKRKGKRGRGAAGKIPVFGLLKRGGKVYAKIIPDARSSTLMPIIERKVTPDSIVYSDCL